MKVHIFRYDGFGVRVRPKGFTNYEATFVRWTDDPGVAVMQCTDGRERYIPTCALEDGGRGFPEQPKTWLLPDGTHPGIVLGVPSRS